MGSKPIGELMGRGSLEKPEGIPSRGRVAIPSAVEGREGR